MSGETDGCNIKSSKVYRLTGNVLMELGVFTGASWSALYSKTLAISRKHIQYDTRVERDTQLKQVSGTDNVLFMS